MILLLMVIVLLGLAWGLADMQLNAPIERPEPPESSIPAIVRPAPSPPLPLLPPPLEPPAPVANEWVPTELPAAPPETAETTEPPPPWPPGDSQGR